MSNAAITLAEVKLWGRSIGAVSLESTEGTAAFQYHPDFVGSGIQVAPLTMPLSDQIYRFPALPQASFHGLPGLLADALPDKYGNALIDSWLATQGRSGDDFNAVERLCYTGSRGIGALEFAPASGPKTHKSTPIDVDALVELASTILSHRQQLDTSFADQRALQQILQVGTSAGGARAKAVIAWNRDTNEVRSGQVRAGNGFEYWLLKFDGVDSNRDKELADPQGYGAIEYAYYLMASAGGINMQECRLFEENGRRHFMTRRFDRDAHGNKRHMQSLAALAHWDFNAAGAHAYEQLLLLIRQLGLPMADIEQQFRRMAFNIVARNQDDHVKNTAFLMDKAGHWSLSPAFDLTYSYNPSGHWTAQHQMTLNGKRDHFSLADFRACADAASMKRGRAEAILNEVRDAVSEWPHFATQAGIEKRWQNSIQQQLRLTIPKK